MAEEIKILLVDDEELVLRSLEKTLLRAGFDVETAEDVNAGLASFTAAQGAGEPFDLAILDLNMPGLDGQGDANAGLVLLSRLVEMDANLPVIILTAFDEVARAKEAVARGARAYFVKGREAGLVELVNRIIED
ncbi:MAG: response regulator [Anaerolineae bacterium]|jgi:two-component system response regulator RegA|nr:response regulator [Anaerolineae bacterium]